MAEMRPVLHLFEVFSRKLYIDGYLCKKDVTSGPQSGWVEYYMELCGSSLKLQRINEEGVDTSVPSAYINIASSNVKITGTIDDETPVRTNVLLLDTGQG